MRRYTLVIATCLLFFVLTQTVSKVFANNLLTNSGFEDGVSSWSKYGGTLEVASDYVHGGTKAARLTSQTVSTKWIYQIVPVNGGAAYVFSGYLIKNSPDISSSILRVAWYSSLDGSGSELSSVDSPSSLTDDSGAEYRSLSTGIIVAPDNAHSSRVKAAIAFSSTAQTSAYFDDFIFEESALPSPTPSLTSSPTPSPTLVPEPTNTPIPNTPTITPTPYVLYKIISVKGDDGSIFDSNDQVKVYIDNNYINGYAPREIKFCSGCKCNPDTSSNNYLCELGNHTIKLEKSGYNQWIEGRNFIATTIPIEVNPVLSKSSASPANTPTPTKTPTPSPTSKLSPTPSLKVTPSVEPTHILSDLVVDRAEPSLSPTVLGVTTDVSPKKKPPIVAFAIIGSGVVFLGLGAFSFIKSKKS